MIDLNKVAKVIAGNSLSSSLDNRRTFVGRIIKNIGTQLFHMGEDQVCGLVTDSLSPVLLLRITETFLCIVRIPSEHSFLLLWHNNHTNILETRMCNFSYYNHIDFNIGVRPQKADDYTGDSSFSSTNIYICEPRYNYKDKDIRCKQLQ